MRSQNANRRFRDRGSSIQYRASRIVLRVLAALLLLVLIAGCGGGGGRGSTSLPPIDAGLFTPNYVPSLLTGLYRWDHLPIRVRFTLPSNWAQLYPANPDLQIDAANEWNPTGLRAIYAVATSGSVDVRVQSVNQSELGGNIQGRTEFMYETTGRMLSASIKVALNTPSGGPVPAGDAQAIIAHELGHALGIAGHSPLAADLMYESYVYGSAKTTTTRDLNTAKTAYPGYFDRSIPLDNSIRPMPAPEIRTGVIE